MKNNEKIILGIDPGTSVLGYGLLKVKGGEYNVLQYGVIHLGKYKNHELKLKKIFDLLLRLIDQYHPDEMALEAPFYGKNVQSMLKLGRAQGVAMAVALSREIPITEYAPKKVKLSVTGRGAASKEQVAEMLKKLLKLESLSHQLKDATDGLAVALCHYFQGGKATKKSQSWSAFLAQNPNKIR